MKKLTIEQMERMTPENRELYLRRLKKVKRNRRILAVAIAVVVVLAVAAVLSMTVFFNISSITVGKNGKIYTEQEIISASGLNVGDNMVRTDFKEVSLRIETMLPYVLSADIDKTFSGAVTITVKDNSASMIFKVKNGYAIADSQGKVLEIVKEIPKKNKLMVLKSSKEMKASPGKHIGFADEKEQELYEQICTALKNAKMYQKITGIDISSPSNIKIEYQGRFRIKIGSITDIDLKLMAATKTIAMEDESDPTEIGEVNVMNPKKVYINPLDTLEETTAPREPKTEKTTQAATEPEEEETEEENEEETQAEADENNEETEEESDTEDEETTSENEEDSSEYDDNSEDEE